MNKKYIYKALIKLLWNLYILGKKKIIKWFYQIYVYYEKNKI